jgi:hypothetical protein
MCVNLILGHTYYEHSVLAQKLGVTSGDVIKVISHRQHRGKTFPNIFCPRCKIVKLDSKFKSNVGYHNFHQDKSH